MKVSKRDRYLLIVCVIGLAILVWGLLNPPAKTTSTAKLLPLNEAQHKTEIARRTTTRLIGEQADNAPRVRKMAYDLPVEQLEPRVIQNLQEIATRAGVHLKEVKPLHPHPLNSGGQSVPLEVRFEAAFQPNVIRFLYFVEDPKGKMVVDKMNVTSTDPRFRAVDVTAQISVFTSAAAPVAATPQGGTKSVTNKTDDV